MLHAGLYFAGQRALVADSDFRFWHSCYLISKDSFSGRVPSSLFVVPFVPSAIVAQHASIPPRLGIRRPKRRADRREADIESGREFVVRLLCLMALHYLC